MQQTDYIICTDKAAIKTLDADGTGQFIALTVEGEVIARDFRTKLKRVRHRAPLEFRYPIIRIIDQNRFLVVNSRTSGKANGKIFDYDGNELDSFYLGDAIEDILVFPNKLVVMYHEEGIMGCGLPNSSGLAVLSLDGEQIWGFNDLVNEKKIPEAALILDNVPLCKKGTNSVLFFAYYNSPQLAELNLDSFELKFFVIPERVHFADSFSPINDDEMIFHRHGSPHFPEPDSNKFFWWDRNTNDVEELPERVSGKLTGIDGGKFLLQNFEKDKDWVIKNNSYAIIDPLGFSVKHVVNIGSRQLEFVLDDITNHEVDAIVNAANSQLAGGFGVDGAIHRRGGAEIMKETREQYPLGCETGSAVASNAGNLKAKYVFHAVGPRWFDHPNRFDLLSSAYNSCLKLAVELDCQSVAFPSISTGDFGYPVKESSVVAIKTVGDFLQSIAGTNIPLKFIRFSLFSEKDLAHYCEAANNYCKEIT
ncbi:MAG: macro domain-containing protein [Planctomycetaceae bacterium]|jgi:O-acetyl-ADP-ribose deacetylase (regulator of RNase III)|nr:macro domain-containing protein [Planctomycetaceae bacterium]